MKIGYRGNTIEYYEDTGDNVDATSVAEELNDLAKSRQG